MVNDFITLVFIIVLVVFAIWIFQDIFSEAYRFLGSNISHKTLRDIMFILLGLDVKWGIDNMSNESWGIVIIAGVLVVTILIIVKQLENLNIRQQRMSDWQFWDRMEHLLTRAVRRGVREARQDERSNEQDNSSLE